MVDLATVVLAADAAGEATKQSKNPILPVANEMFWAAILFFALWALVKWVLLPPIQRGMEARAAKIRDDLDAAETARTEAESALHTYEASLVSAKAEAVRVTEDARARAEADRREKLAAAETEAAAVRARAAQEIVEAKTRARAELTPSIAGIAVGAAEAVVGKQLDRDAQTRVIEDYVNRPGSQN